MSQRYVRSARERLSPRYASRSDTRPAAPPQMGCAASAQNRREVAQPSHVFPAMGFDTASASKSISDEVARSNVYAAASCCEKRLQMSCM